MSEQDENRLQQQKFEVAEELSPDHNPLGNIYDLDVDAIGKKKSGWDFNIFRRGNRDGKGKS